MAEELRVYLDHLIPRESLRYKRSQEKMGYEMQREPQLLRMSDLFGNHVSSQVKFFRKPDFQRATWAWTPSDCVYLLESIIHEQVIPSIILWSSPDNGYIYVLDGGHRISVVLAWLNDDWGDRLSSDAYPDEEEERIIKKAAKEVRDLVKARIGSISDYQAAEDAVDRLVNEGEAPKLKLDPTTFKRGQFYQRLRKGGVGFHILWATGDYERAELSFLRINKSGKQLSDWETKLVENRNSSLARTVMSIANIASAQHYWPAKTTEGTGDAQIKGKVDEIIAGVEDLHDILFKPTYKTPIRSLRQPWLVAPSIQMRPFYLAELLTVVEGGKGQTVETEKLLQKDQESSPETIVQNGWNLIDNAKKVFDSLTGPSPKSLDLVPLLYFYTDNGRHVRSLLYGLIFWLLSGNDKDVLTRKRIFSAHRSALEKLLLERKEDIVTGITRKTGSGPEVTLQTANYYQGAIELLIKYGDETSAQGFAKEYAELTHRLTNKRVRPSGDSEIESRAFTDSQKSTVTIRALMNSVITCGICGGILDPAGDSQHDHVLEYSKGGPTAIDNQRLVHPFCNNQANRESIEELRSGKQHSLPVFITQDFETMAKQLNFFDERGFV